MRTGERITLIQTLANNWMLLLLGGVLEAILSATYWTAYDTVGVLGFHSWHGTVLHLGGLALAAGACAAAAGVYRSAAGKCWPLVVNGLALWGLGVIQYGLTGFRISLLTVALLVIAMGVSAGTFELSVARTLGRQGRVAGGLLFAMAGAALIVSGLAFLVLGLGWITVEPGSHVDLLWLGACFGLSAAGKLGVALRLHFLKL